MSEPQKSFFSRLQSVFLTGLLVILPLGITLGVGAWLIGLVDGLLGLAPNWLLQLEIPGAGIQVQHIPGLGILVTTLLTLFVGAAMRYYTAQRLVMAYEALLNRIPVLSPIYQGLKQLFVTIFSKQATRFQQVVAIEYPRRGLWALAFTTNRILVKDNGDTHDVVSVFLPTTPNPTSGFYLLVPVVDVHLLDLGVEEAFKLIMSAGIVSPEIIEARRLETPARPQLAEP